jgi:hypothetical protein
MQFYHCLEATGNTSYLVGNNCEVLNVVSWITTKYGSSLDKIHYARFATTAQPTSYKRLYTWS